MNDSKARRIRDASSGPGTLISDGCRFEGTLTGHGNFMISGEVIGDCDITGTVTLAREGRWRGLIKADSVVVAGSVEGEIHARGKVEVGRTAKISGTISSDAIAVAEGAIVDGIMRTNDKSGPTTFVEKRDRSADIDDAEEPEEPEALLAEESLVD
jgi:cytoskeletal protein CcmA (bactofilin family)